MHIDPEQLRAFLVDAGLITSEQFEKALKKAEKAGKKVQEILMAEKEIDQEKLVKMEAYILGIPYVSLEKEKIDPKILGMIPESIAKTNNIVAYKKGAGALEVAMIDPENVEIIDFIKKKSGLIILPRMTNATSIKNVLKQYNKSLEVEFGELVKDEPGLEMIKEEFKGEAKKDLEKAAEELPVIKIVDTLIKHAIIEGTSDIHIEPTEREVVVRYRIDGVLKDAMILPKQIATGLVARIKVLSNLKLDEHRLPQDGRFKISNDSDKFSIRVSILPVFYGEKIVMRLLSEQAKALTLEELGFRPNMAQTIKDNLKKPLGMILVTGPTGSGKTTSLYSMMQILNRPEVNISTVEDPVEYQMPRVNQSQIEQKIGFTFANALRALLRQDPNILMVGEIRDSETSALAVNAALTGHLVMSTLHTNNAAGSIPRLLDMKVEPFLLSSTFNMVLAQRLVRKLTGEKEKYNLSKEDINNLSKYCDLEKILNILKAEGIVDKGARIEGLDFYRPRQGSTSGYKGRLGIYEILEIDEDVKRLINQGATAFDIQKQAQSKGMQTMLEDGIIKAAQGLTSIEEVLRVIVE